MEKNSIETYALLLDEISTTRQGNQLIEALEHAVDATYDKTKQIATVLKAYLPFDQTDLILEIAKTQGIDITNSAAAQQFLKSLIETLKKLTFVDLTLAYSPTYDQLTELARWWRVYTKVPYILLDIKVDKELIAGAVIGYNGLMKDYSLHRVLGSYLERKKSSETK